jgi:hypothetical protein
MEFDMRSALDMKPVRQAANYAMTKQTIIQK